MHPLPRLIVSWAVVLGAAALVLKALDHVPTLLVGAPRGVRIYATVEEAERATGARVWVPGYYPDELTWPPARVEVVPTQPAVIALRVAGRDGERDRLVIVQALGDKVAVPPGVLPAGEPMQVMTVTVGAFQATLSRLLLGTREVRDLSWVQGGRRITLRYTGPVDQLLLIGGSLAHRAPGAAHPLEHRAFGPV